MTPDRELLELAAKAAGIPYIKPPPDYSGCYGLQVGSTNPMRCQSWNPLTDNGDALRLAVDLDLAIVPYPIYNKQKHSVLVQKKNLDESRFEKMEMHGNDPRAATRRAIVRAAAEIGKSIP